MQRGRTHLQLMYNQKRPLYPMRRKDGTPRGGEWERITWDDAINEICTKWKSYRAQYGPGSVCISSLPRRLPVLPEKQPANKRSNGIHPREQHEQQASHQFAQADQQQHQNLLHPQAGLSFGKRPRS